VFVIVVGARLVNDDSQRLPCVALSIAYASIDEHCIRRAHIEKIRSAVIIIFRRRMNQSAMTMKQTHLIAYARMDSIELNSEGVSIEIDVDTEQDKVTR
jgi:hypothetical protein